MIALNNQRTRTAQGENLVEDAVGEFALGHLVQLDGGGSGEERGSVVVGIDAHALARHIVDHDGVRALAQQLGAAVLHAVFASRRQSPR